MAPSKTNCPACGSRSVCATVTRDRIPAMQNYVFRTREAALAAKVGEMRIDACRECGFAYNAKFDSQLLDYDEGYDNSVPSKVMHGYYTDLAAYLHEKYLPSGGLVLDIGCGKGTFLSVMCERFADTSGLGIDPSYEGPEVNDWLRLKFVKEFFSEQQVNERPRLVVCRHVLEHIESPVAFFKSIRAGLSRFPDVPVFVEVPSLSWIVDHNAFWDFCYEHCNYFTAASFAHSLSLAGFEATKSSLGFGDQYLWYEGIIRDESSINSNGRSTETETQLLAYCGRENELIAKARQRILSVKADGHAVVVWGMATKGILFSTLLDPERSLIDCCVDINTNKQGCFTPVVGHEILSPDSLARYMGRPVTVVVMNTNYHVEIERQCLEMNLSCSFINANGDLL